MKRSVLLILWLISSLQLGVSQSLVIHGDIEGDALKDISFKIKDAHNDLNLRYSDFLVTIVNYNVLALNLANYDDDYPVIDQHSNYSVHLLDKDCYYLIPLTDTLEIYEEIDLEHIENKMIRITSLDEKEKDVYYKVSLSALESINQMPPAEVDFWEGMENDLVRWEGISPYVEIVNSARSCFYVPEVESLSNLPYLKQTLALGDTCVHYEGELSYTATLIYKGKPTVHQINGVLLRIEKYTLDTLIETKFLKVYFAYGC